MQVYFESHQVKDCVSESKETGKVAGFANINTLQWPQLFWDIFISKLFTQSAILFSNHTLVTVGFSMWLKGLLLIIRIKSLEFRPKCLSRSPVIPYSMYSSLYAPL